MSNYKEFINLPYKSVGRDFDGIDCFGIVYLVYKLRKNILLPDFTDLKYKSDWSKTENHIVENIYDDFIEVQRPYKELDLLLFYGKVMPNVVNHIGLYVDDDKFLHISENYSSMISRLDNYWKDRLYKVLRHKRMIDNA